MMRRRASPPASGRPRTALALALAAIALALVPTLRAQDERARIPRLQQPPPLDPRFLQRLEGSVRTTISDVSFRTAIGQMVSFARLEIVMDPDALATDGIHARLVRVVSPSFISPVDTITTPFDPFVEIPGPRTRIDRLVIENGTFGAHAHPSQYEGRWLWRAQHVDLDLRDIALGGGGPVAARLASAVASAELEGRPIVLRAASAAVRRSGDVLDVDASARLASSDVNVTGTVRRDGGYRAAVRARPVAFADARAFVRALPAEGTAEIDATLAGAAGTLDLGLRTLVARVRSSVITARGAVRAGSGGVVRDLVVEIPTLVAADVETLLDLSLPVDGVWRGGFRADGPLAAGVAVTGSLERMDVSPSNGSTTAPLPRITLEGTVRSEPEAALALRLDARSIPVRDGSAAAELGVSGSLDSLAIGGSVRATGIGAAEQILARLDAVVLDRAGEEDRLLRGTTDVSAALPATADTAARVVRAHAEGSAVLAANGRLDARVVTDPVPLAILPLPAALDSVAGDARADLRLGGTVEKPLLAGTIEVRHGRFLVPSARLDVNDVGGAIIIRDGIADLGGLGARANGGTLDLDGTVRLLGGERVADVRLLASDVTLAATDSVRVVAGADIAARGALSEPLVRTDARLTLARPAGTLALATLTGTIDLSRGGALEGVLRADSLPLDALPAPSALRDLRGALTGSLRIGGALDSITSHGAFDLQDAGVTVVRTGTALHDLRGRAVVRDGVVTLEGVRGVVGGGPLSIEGEARIAGAPRAVNASLTIERGLVVDADSMQIVASADLGATGELARPIIDGSLVLHEGWVHEDNFARNPPIDTAAPPHDELVDRVPWIADSRLRAGVARPITHEPPREPGRRVILPAPPRDVAQAIEERETPPLMGRIRVDIERGLRLVDEDSEIRGEGTVYLIADSAGVRTEGLYRMIGGYYAQYGSVFEIRGGAFLFAGEGVSPIVSMRSEQRFEAPLGAWLTPGARIMDRFPPLHFFALGSQQAAREEVRRLSLLPESRTELGALLLYNEEPQPVTGLRTHSFWAPDDGGALFGESSATRGAVLVYNYIANESYDYLPLQRAWVRAGVIDIGPSRPGRITIGPYIQGGLRFGALHALLTQPVEGGTAPGIRLRYRIGAPELLAFSEPRFLSIAPVFPGGEVFTHGRRTGLGIRWLWEW